MPELPEVRTVCFHLNNRIKDLTVKRVDVRLEKILKGVSKEDFETTLVNKKVLSVTNRGKWIIIHFEDDNNVIVHLRLEGKFRTKDDPNVNPKHDHVIFEFTDGTHLYFNDTRQFGTFHLMGKDFKLKPPVAKLGYKLNEVDIDALFNKLKRKTIPIKSTLLDQELLIGLGNIYVNEVLWKTQVDPSTKTNAITKEKLQELIKVSHEVMEHSFELGGSTIKSYSSLDGVQGSYQNELVVHMREKEDCPRCNNPIQKMKVGGRGTYWCPTCQKR